MRALYSKIELYKRAGDKEGDWETTPTLITQFFGLIIKKGSGTKKDTFKFDLLNNYNKYTNPTLTIEKSDRVKIYQKVNSKIFTQSDLLLDGVINKITSANSTNKLISIEGKSRTEQLLEGLTFISRDDYRTPPQILEEALTFHNNNNKNFLITWHPDNPSLNSNDESFPTHLVEEFYKPMYMLFERYSSNEYTKDGQYYYYVTNDNKLRWDKKTTTIDSSIDESSCEMVNINDNSDYIINSLVINCGLSPSGDRVRAYYFDYASRAKEGAKWKYLTKTNRIINDIIQAEKLRGITFDTTKQNFPDSTEYPFTTRWGTSITDDNSWNDAVIEYAKDLGLEWGKSYLQGLNQSRLQATVQLPFTNDYELMQYITCTFPSFGVDGIPLRITDIQYTDYNTILTLLQDEET